MLSTDNFPGPGAYIGVESKIGGPRFTMHGRDGVSKETLEKSKLQRSKSEGAPAGKRDIRRCPFHPALCLSNVSVLFIVRASSPPIPANST